ncbi:MAG: site-specific integrase [Aphanocapsa sp. GSE-SYN-MK-11-07L]|jgi:integrase|nr:site-specific integrase [Aphanocapsa sp. GSE-SYN-MK-11-07L]
MKCTIENHNGRLRLRWRSQEGKRYTMGCGVNDHASGRAIAKLKAAQIEKDLLNDYFDPTLLKYRPRILGKNATEISAPELFERYAVAMKREKRLTPNAYQKYRATLSHLKRFFGEVNALSIGSRRAGDFTAYLLERMAGQTAKPYLFLLRGCWNWAQGKYHTTPENPWSDEIAKVKPQPQQRTKPFARAEITAILNGFKSDRHYSHYADVVAFLFGTGCRPGEAFGLRWRNVADDFGTAQICQTVSRGHHRNQTKTGKSRTIIFNPSIQAMLKTRYLQQQPQPDRLVFASPTGKPIDDKRFNQRAWKTVLERLGIDYRRPNTMRHSAISHALANGVNPIDLAEQTGHDKRVLLSTYAHAISQQSLFVEFE